MRRDHLTCGLRYFPYLALQTLWTGVSFDVGCTCLQQIKAISYSYCFIALARHVRGHFIVAAELWPWLPEPCDIHSLFCFYRAAVSWRIKLRYPECELWVLINLVMLCGLGTARVFPIYDLRVHFVQPMEQLASLWNGYPVNTYSPWRAVTMSCHGIGDQKVDPLTTALVLASRYASQRKTEVRERKENFQLDENMKIFIAVPYVSNVWKTPDHEHLKLEGHAVL